MPPQAPPEPNGLLLFGLCVLGACALIGLLKLNHWLHTRRDYVAPGTPMLVEKPDTRAVHVPVPGIDTRAGTTLPARDITEDAEMPRVGRRLSDDAIVAMLATQKGEDGAKYRFSANQIYELVKGPRAEVLDRIRTIREGPVAPQVREHQARLAEIQAAHADSR